MRFSFPARIRAVRCAALLCLVLATFTGLCACDSKSSYSNDPETTASTSASKADSLIPPDEAVDRCVEAYAHLFGPFGCVPGVLSPERIQVACEGYSAWAARGEACGSGAFAKFFQCLEAIGCDRLVKDEESEIAEYPKDYDACTEQFARDMNECIDEKAEKTK